MAGNFQSLGPENQHILVKVCYHPIRNVERIAQLCDGLHIDRRDAHSAEYPAQEHLEPEHGVFSVWTAAYQERIREVFAEGYRYDVLLKAIILDSSSTESLIALRQSPDGLETVHLAAATDIWNHSFLPQPEGSRRRSEIAPIQIKVTRRPIDKHTADDIMTLWKKVLLETRYAEPGRFGKDGVIYMFSMKDPYRGILSGQIWSPEAKSRMEHFTHLAESLVRYTHQSLTQTELDQVVNNTRHFLAP